MTRAALETEVARLQLECEQLYAFVEAVGLEASEMTREVCDAIGRYTDCKQLLRQRTRQLSEWSVSAGCTCSHQPAFD